MEAVKHDHTYPRADPSAAGARRSGEMVYYYGDDGVMRLGKSEIPIDTGAEATMVKLMLGLKLAPGKMEMVKSPTFLGARLRDVEQEEDETEDDQSTSPPAKRLRHF